MTDILGKTEGRGRSFEIKPDTVLPLSNYMPSPKPLNPALSVSGTLPGGIARVGRQPILDRRRRTYGYELLYRPSEPGGAWTDGNQATARTMLSAFVDFGLNQLTGDRRVFINLTRAFFTDMEPLPLDKQRLVLEVLEDIEIDAPMIAGAKRMCAAGYTLALDDYRFEPRWGPLLPYAGIVKVDIMNLDLARYKREIQALRDRGLTLLAEKVETHEQFDQCRSLGFDLFQGFFFAKPQIVSGKTINSNGQLLMKLLARINDPACRIDELAKLVSLDPNLSFKLLRCINSAAMGLPRQVASIQEAVVYIGLGQLRSWTTLLAMSGLNNQAAEVITTSLVRAEICERLCRKLGNGAPDSAYTVGLLSVLDTLLEQPMATLVGTLGLSPQMTAGLVAHAGPYGQALACALAMEKGQWQHPATRLLPSDALSTLFVDALSRADKVQHGLS